MSMSLNTRGVAFVDEDILENPYEERNITELAILTPEEAKENIKQVYEVCEEVVNDDYKIFIEYQLEQVDIFAKTDTEYIYVYSYYFG